MLELKLTKGLLAVVFCLAFTSHLWADDTNPILATDTCLDQLPGDIDGDGYIKMDDIGMLGLFLCYEGNAPNPLANGDVNGDCVIDSLDLVYLLTYYANLGPAPVECTCLNPSIGECPVYECSALLVGDGNNDSSINIGDAVYLINGVFKCGDKFLTRCGAAPKPYPLYSGDANCDCAYNISDAVYVINYVFKGGPPPCSCEDWLSFCGPPFR